jgi:threonine aldolase
LEERVAELLGKPVALFCASGTMANQVALRTHCAPGTEIIVDETAHIFASEAGGAGLAGLQTRTVTSMRELLDTDKLIERIRPAGVHDPRTSLICFENTHNFGGGVVAPQEQLAAAAAMASQGSIAVHLDGARLFNAHVAGGRSLKELASVADSVSVCLSKGLGCPMGSLLVGTKAFVERARHVRQALGGGLRQAGLMAACGLVALEDHLERLSDDHRRAHQLAEGLGNISGIRLLRDAESTYTNMVYFAVDGGASAAQSLLEYCARHGVLLIDMSATTLRMVCHLDIDDRDIAKALEVIANYQTR